MKSERLKNIIDCHNISNWSVTINDSPELAPLHQILAGCIIFLVILPLILFNWRCFPIGTTIAALLGGFLMVITTVIKPEEVYDIIGNHGYIRVAMLMLSLMLLAQFIEREQLLVKLLRKVLSSDMSFENYIWRVCVISAIMSAFLTSGATCAVLTPLVSKYWEVQERTRQEIQTLLIAISTCANIGSVATIFGNLQMAIIAAKTALPQFQKSHLSMQTCLMYMICPVIITFLINLGFLICHFKIRTRRLEIDRLISEASHSEQEMHGLTGSPKLNGGFVRKENGYVSTDNFDRSVPCQLETIPEDDILEITEVHRSTEVLDTDQGFASADTASGGSDSSEEGDEIQQASSSTAENLSTPSLDYRPSVLTLQNMEEAQRQIQAQETASLDKKLEQHGVKIFQKMGLYRSLSGVSLVEFLPSDTGLHQMSHTDSMDNVFTPAESTTFQVLVCLLVVIVLALSLAWTQHVPFDAGLISAGAVTLTFLFDAMLNHRVCMSTLKRVDVSVILLFYGVILWTQGLINTNLPQWLWTKSRLAQNLVILPYSLFNLVLFSCIVILASSLLTNVPTTIVILSLLRPCEYELPLVMYLAWCGTIAGNLTQFSSPAGIIVAQKSQQAIKYRVSYWDYFKFGFPTTLVHLFVGGIILFGMLQIPM